MPKGALLALVTLWAALSGAAHAGTVALQSAVYVEKTVADAGGRNRITLEAPKSVSPGDRLVFILTYRNDGTAPAANVVITNPVPTAVSFQNAPTGPVQVSIDGGRSWGAITALTVRDADGSIRPARSSDVTHLRWEIARPVPPGGAGRILFRGTVK